MPVGLAKSGYVMPRWLEWIEAVVMMHNGDRD